MNCLNCNSDNVLTDLDVRDKFDAGPLSDTQFTIQKDRKPEALLFKDTVRIPIKAHICADCKYVMFFGTTEVYKEVIKDE